MARIGERQNFESLCREHARQSRPAVGRQIHDLFAAGAAVKENKGPTRIGFFFRRIERAVHVPVIAVAPITRPSIGSGYLSRAVRRFDREPFIPGQLQQQVVRF